MQGCHHIETRQLIFGANHLTGFYMKVIFAFKGLNKGLIFAHVFQYSCQKLNQIICYQRLFNLFLPNVPILYPQKTPECL